MATLADLQTAVHAAVRALEAKLGAGRAGESHVFSTLQEFDAAVAANNASAAVEAARRVAAKATEGSAKDAAGEIIDTLERMDPEF